MALRCCQRETPSPDAPVPLGAADICAQMESSARGVA
jgi:hypothetical protein